MFLIFCNTFCIVSFKIHSYWTGFTLIGLDTFTSDCERRRQLRRESSLNNATLTKNESVVAAFMAAVFDCGFELVNPSVPVIWYSHCSKLCVHEHLPDEAAPFDSFPGCFELIVFRNCLSKVDANPRFSNVIIIFKEQCSLVPKMLNWMYVFT